MKFCPKCGKDTNQLINGLCTNCYFEKNDIVEGFKDTEIEVCTVCEKVKTDFWSKRSDDDFVESAVKKNIKFKKGVVIKNIDVDFEFPEFEEKNRAESIATITVTAEIDNQEVSMEYQMPVGILKTTCPLCTKVERGYFEGNLQLRPITHKYFMKAHEFIVKDVEQRKKEGIQIQELEELKEGFDYYLSRKIYLQTLAKKVVENFGGHISVNSKLFSYDKQRSKDIKRLTVLVRLPEFEPDDVIIIKNKLLIITKIKGHTVHGIDIENNKRTNYDYRQFKPQIVAKANQMEKDDEGNMYFEYNDKKYRVNLDDYN